MAIFYWNDSYSVGINELDENHKYLFSLVNRLYSAMKEGKGSLELAEIMVSLENYACDHFQREENLLRKANYPGLERHVQEHVKLAKEIKSYREKFSQQQIGVSVQVANFLKEWLSKHILTEDKKYAQYLQPQKV